MMFEDDPPARVPEWMVSFGDMMSLLLSFFILLVSMSELKKDDKFQGVVDSLREQFGDSLSTVSLLAGEVRPPNGLLVKLSKTARHQREESLKGVKVSGPKSDFGPVERVQTGKRFGSGLVLIFDERNAVLTEEAKEKMQQLKVEIAGRPQKMEIRGHSSLKPLNPEGEIKDHWDLAYQRATATMQYLVKDLGIDPKRIRVTSAGANEPNAAENAAGNTLQNSRVEIMILEEVVASLLVEDAETASANDLPASAFDAEKPSANKTSAEKKTP